MNNIAVFASGFGSNFQPPLFGGGFGGNFQIPSFGGGFDSNFQIPSASTDVASTDATSTDATSTEIPDWYNSMFEYKGLNDTWNNDILNSYTMSSTATGLYGNVHGVSALLSRYVGDYMPTAQQDPTAPGNTWIYTTTGNPYL